MTPLLLAVAALALFIAAVACYGMDPARHMAPIGDMLLVAAVCSAAALIIPRLTARPSVRTFVYGALWLVIALCPFVIGYVRNDQTGLMGMLTIWGFLPAGFFLVRGERISLSRSIGTR